MMDSPSGITSNSSAPLTNSSSEEDLRLSMDQRKRKRMISNRESARRSRLRKQKLLDELKSQVARLRLENHEILTGLTVTTRNYLNVEAENVVLRAQVAELSNRLESLSDILGLLSVAAEPLAHGFGGWNSLLSQTYHHHHHHVMASADVSLMY